MTDLPITLYYAPRTRAERVKKLLDVFEIPHELVTLDYQAGEQKSEEYLRDVHPLGRVPALKHGDHVVLESAAICMYLADLFPDKGMAPPVGTIERGSYYEWFLLFHATIEPIVVAAGSQDDETHERHVAELHEALAAITPRIREPHVLGEQFTAADVMLHTELFWYKLLGIYPEGNAPLDAYYERLRERMGTPEL